MKLAVLVACCACLYAGGANLDCPHWLSVMPLHEGCGEELAADAADLGNTTFIDGVAWSCAVNPEGDPVSDKAAVYAARYRETEPVLRKMSHMRQGVLLQSTMGHGGFPGSPAPWQLSVKPDGSSVYRMCPLDERFLAYMARTCRTFAGLKPDFFMVDDDTRIIFDGAPGCFCPLHLAEFARRTGRSWTRQEVVAMLRKGNSRDAETWKEVKIDSLRRFFRTIRDNFPPDIPGMLCVVRNSLHMQHAREFAQILAAPGQSPVVRGSGAPYHGRELFHVANVRSSYAAQRDILGDGVVLMQESDTCPHTLWATSAVRTYDHLVMLALEGCKGAKIWITRTGNYHEKKSAQAYRRIFRENCGLVKWAAKVDFRQEGMVVPTCGPMTSNFGDRYLALVGIPYRFGKARPGEITALTVETLMQLRPDSIREMLSGLVVLDGPAAVWLSKNGFSKCIGVAAKEWKRKTIQVHKFENGDRQLGMRTDGLADLTDTAEGARVLTKLLNRPCMGAEPVYEAPGAVLFENRDGGKVLVLAQRIPRQGALYYESEFLSEGYKAAFIRWLKLLGGRLPGGVCYLGAGPVTCEAGTTSEGDDVIVLNAMDLDGDDMPEFQFDRFPSSMERLQGDGTWDAVPFEKTPAGGCRVKSPVIVQRPAIFRWK